MRAAWSSIRETPTNVAREEAGLVDFGPVLLSCGSSTPSDPVWIYMDLETCNLCGHLQRCQMPDIANSQKTAEKVPSGSRQNSRERAGRTAETSENSQKNSAFSGVLPAVLRLFYRDPLGTPLSGCFSAVFRLAPL